MKKILIGFTLGVTVLIAVAATRSLLYDSTTLTFSETQLMSSNILSSTEIDWTADVRGALTPSINTNIIDAQTEDETGATNFQYLALDPANGLRKVAGANLPVSGGGSSGTGITNSTVDFTNYGDTTNHVNPSEFAPNNWEFYENFNRPNTASGGTLPTTSQSGHAITWWGNGVLEVRTNTGYISDGLLVSETMPVDLSAETNGNLYGAVTFKAPPQTVGMKYYLDDGTGGPYAASATMLISSSSDFSTKMLHIVSSTNGVSVQYTTSGVGNLAEIANVVVNPIIQESTEPRVTEVSWTSPDVISVSYGGVVTNVYHSSISECWGTNVVWELSKHRTNIVNDPKIDAIWAGGRSPKVPAMLDTQFGYSSATDPIISILPSALIESLWFGDTDHDALVIGGQILFSNVWNASRGSFMFHDNTEEVVIPAILRTETGAQGDVVTFNTNGTFTLEAAAAGSQTPITQNIDYAGYDISDLGNTEWASGSRLINYPANVNGSVVRTNEGSHQFAKFGVNTNMTASTGSTNDWIRMDVEGGGFTLSFMGTTYPTRSSGITGFEIDWRGGTTNLSPDYATSALLAANIFDETGSAGGGVAVFSENPTINDAALSGTPIAATMDVTGTTTANGDLSVELGFGLGVGTVSGTGGANTNFTILATGDNSIIYVDAGTTNVNLLAIMGYSDTKAYRGVIVLTNRTATPRTFSLGEITNNWTSVQKFDGIEAPFTVTNSLAGRFVYEILGTNVQYAYKPMSLPSN